MNHCLNPECLFINSSQHRFCQKCGTKLMLVERYRAIKIIGQGGFGRTFLAVDELKPSKPPCVIKQFLPQAQGTDTIQKAAELFAQEAMRLDELGKHSQIPELLAYLTQENRQYLVQEFIDGENLQTELEQKGKFNEEKIRDLLTDILNILQFVHSKGVIHRDIKPENIIRRKEDNKLVLVDFGAAKVAPNTRLSVTGTVIGSAEYTAPEQAIGKAQYASDLYSLGVTCIHLLTQVSPFELYDVSESDWVWRDFLLNNKVSDDLGQVLDKLIVQATKRRFQSVDEVFTALNIEENVVIPSPTPQSNYQPRKAPTINLVSSETRVDYTPLNNLLAAGEWKEADEITYNLMKKATNREKEGWIDYQSYKNFPREDLKIMDDLWGKYSNGKFGFSVQKKIWIEVGGTPGEYSEDVFERFGDRIGWRNSGQWLSYSDLTFNINAPEAHLPCGGGVWVLFSSLDYKP
ncbi:MAG: GUN4 domain-containing protein [Gomphosphaeria aponina SAG 52.96 = DSM 107014]|uniref:non-specific serine/threonine protein kinase n=1 Tax=Gomphosphaeria aponina SAG 52.96 = DSM 107014 TaxID=1521640 RepID=A0A941GSR0_9CHRO|nr:GUN4 domain-containing protein [Gomphosphaeria aponina SAG 52.96 = DSM 107014]